MYGSGACGVRAGLVHGEGGEPRPRTGTSALHCTTAAMPITLASAAPLMMLIGLAAIVDEKPRPVTRWKSPSLPAALSES